MSNVMGILGGYMVQANNQWNLMSRMGQVQCHDDGWHNETNECLLSLSIFWYFHKLVGGSFKSPIEKNYKVIIFNFQIV
jgi:hypothetical protein